MTFHKLLLFTEQPLIFISQQHHISWGIQMFGLAAVKFEKLVRHVNKPSHFYRKNE